MWILSIVLIVIAVLLGGMWWIPAIGVTAFTCYKEFGKHNSMSTNRLA